MEKYDLKNKKIKLHNIVITITSSIDYYMERYMLLEDLEDLKSNEFVVVEGSHCSCYGFDDTEWEAIKYTEVELLKLATEKAKKSFWYAEEKQFYKLILDYFRGNNEQY